MTTQPTKDVLQQVAKKTGKTVEEVVKSLASYEAQAERARKYNEARRKAQSELAKMFPKEYKALLKKFNPNHK